MKRIGVVGKVLRMEGKIGSWWRRKMGTRKVKVDANYGEKETTVRVEVEQVKKGKEYEDMDRDKRKTNIKQISVGRKVRRVRKNS